MVICLGAAPPGLGAHLEEAGMEGATGCPWHMQKVHHLVVLVCIRLGFSVMEVQIRIQVMFTLKVVCLLLRPCFCCN